MHDEVEREEDGEGDERHHPADEQHDGHAQQEPHHRHPHVVVLGGDRSVSGENNRGSIYKLI